MVVLATWGHAPWTGNVPGGGGGPGTQPLAAVEGAGAALFYSMNWLEIHHAFSSYVPIGHLWSLAVEEQFYLLWAPVAAVLLRWRGRGVAGAAAALLAAASFVDVAVVHGGAYLHAVVDMGTDTRAGAFLAGAALAAVWSRGGAVVDAFAGRWRLPVLAAVVGVMAWSSDILNRTTTPALFAGCFVAVSLASGALVLAVLVPPGGHRKGLLASKVLTYLGRRSYALYLWHYVWITWFRSLGTPGIVLAFVASLASAEVSWRLVERPALARKARFTPGRRPTDALAGAASPTSPPPSPSSSELSERRVRV